VGGRVTRHSKRTIKEKGEWADECRITINNGERKGMETGFMKRKVGLEDELKSCAKCEISKKKQTNLYLVCTGRGAGMRGGKEEISGRVALNRDKKWETHL